MSYLPFNDACVHACCKRTKMHSLIREGKIIARKHGSRTIVELASLNAYLASLPQLHIKKHETAAPLKNTEAHNV